MHLIKNNKKKDIQIVIAKYALITVWPFYNGFLVTTVIADALILPPAYKICNMNIEKICTEFCSFKNIKAKLWHWFLFFCCSSAYSCICRESRQWLTAGEYLESGLGLVQGENTEQLSKIHYVFTYSCLPFQAVVIIFKSQLLLSRCRTISLCCDNSSSAGVLSVDFHCSRSLNKESNSWAFPPDKEFYLLLPCGNPAFLPLQTSCKMVYGLKEAWG